MKTEASATVIMAMAEPEPFEPSRMHYETGMPEVIVESTAPVSYTHLDVYKRQDMTAEVNEWYQSVKN